MTDQDLFIPVNWQDHGEADLALDAAESAFAELCYLQNHPPIPSEFVGRYTRAIPKLGEPAWPIWAKYDLYFRCIYASRRIADHDDSYIHYRSIDTPEEREAARERRTRAKRAAEDWRESGNQVAMEDMLEALEEMHAERAGTRA